MKKVLKIGTLPQLTVKDSISKSCILAYRTGLTYQIQSLEVGPKISIEKSKDSDELIIRMRLSDGEFLALDEEAGMAEKFKI